MYTVRIADTETWDPVNRVRTIYKGGTFSIEHSLLSMRKWEQKYHMSFVKRTDSNSMTDEEFVDYVRMMTIDDNVDPSIYLTLLKVKNTSAIWIGIYNYINDPMTAIKFPKEPDDGATVFNETIYDWMIELGIPFECETWHLNNLISLIKYRTRRHSKQTKKTPVADRWKQQLATRERNRAITAGKL